MRKLFAIVAVVGMVAFMSQAQTMSRLPGVLFPSDRGPRNLATLTNSLAGVASLPYTFALDRGTWVVTDDLTVPTNVTVFMLPGAKFSISSGKTLELLGGFVAGVEEVFTGSGTASGPAVFPYRIPEWGSTSQYAIGEGYLETEFDSRYSTFSTNDSYTYADGTTQSVDRLVVRGPMTGTTATVDRVVADVIDVGVANVDTGNLDVANIGDLNVTGDFLNPSNDMAISFMGFPKLTLTTNMLTIVSSGGTPLTHAQFTNALDNDLSTVTATASGNANAHVYQFDLTEGYTGWLTMKASAYSASGSVAVDGFSGYSSSQPSGIADGQYFFRGSLANQGGTTNAQIFTIPINGRWAGFHFICATAAGSYIISDMSIYGTTNGYRNMGGSAL